MFMLFLAIEYCQLPTPIFLKSVVVLFYPLNMLLHLLQFVQFRFTGDSVDGFRGWEVRWIGGNIIKVIIVS